MSAASCFKLMPEDADALGWVDLADPIPWPQPPRQPVANPVTDPLFLSSVQAQQRGVQGDVTLDVLLDPAGTWIEIGPLRFKTTDAFSLHRLLTIAKAMLAQAVVCPPWEGETRP